MLPLKPFDNSLRSSNKWRRAISPPLGAAVAIRTKTFAQPGSVSALSMKLQQPNVIRDAGSLSESRPGCSKSSIDWMSSSATAVVSA
jgi:hypothetical protein